MSVGVQRLRDEPDRIRQGAIDKREDPALVDRAIERRRAPAPAPGRVGRRSRPSATRASKQIGEAIRGGAKPDGPEVAELRDAIDRAGARIDEIDAELAAAEAELEDLLLRIPNPADPDVPVGGEEANVTVRTWGDPHRARRDVGAATARPGSAGRTGSWARRSTSSTTSAARRSPAPGSPSTRAWARGSSAA